MTGPQRVVVGRVTGAHGVLGGVQVRTFGEAPDNLMRASVVTLAESEDDAGAVDMEVAGVEPGRPGEVRIMFHGVGAREQALVLRGQLVMMDAAQIAPLPEGEYYEYELVGCRVEREDGSEIGTVREVWSTGAADVLVVEDEAGQQNLIPTADDFLRAVDLDARRIVVEVIPGLLDTP